MTRVCAAARRLGAPDITVGQRPPDFACSVGDMRSQTPHTAGRAPAAQKCRYGGNPGPLWWTVAGRSRRG